MNFRDILLALLVILIWGGNIIAIKIGVTELSPTVILAIRFALTGAIFLPFIKWPGWAKFKILLEIAIYMGVLHQGLLFIGLRMLDASTIAILLQSQIMFATLLGWLVLKESIGWRTASGLGLGFLGLLLTLGGPDLSQHPMGFVIIMMSTLALAASYIRMRQLKDVHPATFIALMNGLAAPFVLIVSLFLAPAAWLTLGDANWFKLGGVLVYQVVFVSLSHILWQALLSRNQVASVTSFVLLMPVVAILLSIALLGEEFHTSLLWGGVLTLAGVGIITLRKAQKKMPIEADPVL